MKKTDNNLEVPKAEDTANQEGTTPEVLGTEAPKAEAPKAEDTANQEGTTPEASGTEAPKAEAPKGKKKLSKKQIIFIIVASVLIVAILVATLTVRFVIFNDTVYAVDLDAIRAKTPVFEDQFNTFDTNVWNKEVYYSKEGEVLPRRGGYWTNDQVFTENGNLIIRTEKKDGKWVTGAVTSYGGKQLDNNELSKGYAKKFGYFETRCILPPGTGMWSAFWMMSREFGKVDSFDASLVGSEIDIFEAPNWPNNQVQQAIHIGGYNDMHASIFNPRWTTFDKYKNLYSEYHTYGLYWNAEIYKFYVDGVCRWTTNYSNNVSQKEEYVLFSVEIGGEGGVPKSNVFWGGNKIDTNEEGDAFRSDFKIDYLKVWDV